MGRTDLTFINWRKSTYSGPDGASCLEVAGETSPTQRPGTPSDDWRKSTHRGPDGAGCVEAGAPSATFVAIRDSKNPGGPELVFTAAEWGTFLDEVKHGRIAT
jgi:hypothetical protein